MVYATFNDSKVQQVRWKIYGTEGADDFQNPYPKEKSIRYPKAGTANPEVKLWMVDLSDPGDLKSSELKPPNLFRGDKL